MMAEPVNKKQAAMPHRSPAIPGTQRASPSIFAEVAAIEVRIAYAENWSYIASGLRPPWKGNLTITILNTNTQAKSKNRTGMGLREQVNVALQRRQQASAGIES
jgi:hypothetical protein